MSTFPDVVGRQVRTPEKFEYRHDGEDGGIQIMRPFPLVRHRFMLTWAVLTFAEFVSLESHHRTNDGSFRFFDQWASGWTDLAVGTGDGVQTLFTLPAKTIVEAGLVIEVGGVPTTAFTFSAGTGVDGEDRITFTAAPANGAVITCSFSDGRRRFDVYYSAAPPQPDNNEADIWQWGAELLEKIS